MVLVTQVGALVQTAVASTAASGRNSGAVVASVAAASIAWLIFMLPHSVVTVSVATAYFTRMTKHAQDERLDLFKDDLTTGLRVIALVSVLSSTVLIVLAYPVARVFVGEYPATIALGNVIIALMIGLVPFSFVYLMQRAFFSLEDTRTPFVFTTIQIALHITGSILLGMFIEKQWLVVSLSLLTGFTVLVQGLIAYVLLKKRIGLLSGHGIRKALILFLLAALPSGGIGYFALQLLGGLNPNGFALDSVLSSIVSCTIVAGVMAICYFGLLWLLRVSELRELTKAVKLRLKRS
jgi:putative peptidoglycan lipid II flippase